MSANQTKPHSRKAPDDPAVNLIRNKINSLYNAEPSAKAELKEVKEGRDDLSKHQLYMKELSESGRSLAEIQTKWHQYYQNLPDTEKHEVWREFYKANATNKPEQKPDSREHPPKKTHIYNDSAQDKPVAPPRSSIADVKKKITRRVQSSRKRKLQAKEHFKSLLFGFSLGGAVLIVLLFGFFNERFIAPFITPSKSVSSTPIIIDPTTSSSVNEPLAIVPKINVEVPVVYDVNSIQEKDIQAALENGVVHYATTPKPGEQGNSVIVGHSSNNLFNSGKYKFAFVLLNRLEEGDTFSLTRDGKRYVYRIYEKKVVTPTDVSVLGATDRPATATLITCDPPGTSINRLIVIGEQISPSPEGNVESTQTQTAGAEPAIVPGNAPSLWSRFTNWLTG